VRLGPRRGVLAVSGGDLGVDPVWERSPGLPTSARADDAPRGEHPEPRGCVLRRRLLPRFVRSNIGPSPKTFSHPDTGRNDVRVTPPERCRRWRTTDMAALPRAVSRNHLLVYQDAEKHSQHPAFFWAIVVFLAPLLGLVLYFLLGRNGGAGGGGHGSSQIWRIGPESHCSRPVVAPCASGRARARTGPRCAPFLPGGQNARACSTLS